MAVLPYAPTRPEGVAEMVNVAHADELWSLPFPLLSTLLHFSQLLNMLYFPIQTSLNKNPFIKKSLKNNKTKFNEGTPKFRKNQTTPENFQNQRHIKFQKEHKKSSKEVIFQKGNKVKFQVVQVKVSKFDFLPCKQFDLLPNRTIHRRRNPKNPLYSCQIFD
jgi:hypothetical protein